MNCGYLKIWGQFTEDVLVNRISLETGHTQYCEEYGGSKTLGHGQDLSIEYTSSGSRMLWIGSESDRGVTRVDPETKTIDVLSNLLLFGIFPFNTYYGTEQPMDSRSRFSRWQFFYK